MAPVDEKSKLPLTHPEYRYLESWNPYSKKLEEVKGYAYSDNETETHAGNWRAHFPDAAEFARLNESAAPGRRKLHVEVGCNAGHVILEWAKRDPETAYIGIDWKFKVIHRAAEKAKSRGLRNLIFFRAHADRLRYMFGPGEVDELSLFFPDPWPKKSQWKNRFLNEENLRALAQIVRPGGIFHIKTDHAGYFEWMEEAVSRVSDIWEVRHRTTDKHANVADPTALQIPEVTLFERLFIKDKIRINELKLERI